MSNKEFYKENPFTGEVGTFSGVCNFCGKVGHKMSDC